MTKRKKQQSDKFQLIRAVDDTMISTVPLPYSSRVIGYLRVSTTDQDTDKNKAAILKFANDMKWGKHVEFEEEKVSGMKSWKKRKLKEVVDSMKVGDILIVPELSRLGRSLVEVLEVLNVLKDKNVSVFSVKENFELNGSDIQSKVMRTMLGLFAEIERDLISARTKEGLAARRASGKPLGRPKGTGKSKLDQYQPEIVTLIKDGVPKSFIARRYKISAVALHNWLKKHGLYNIKPQP
jgi:DNA invertase Pin-like site-specific DNA recombinase